MCWGGDGEDAWREGDIGRLQLFPPFPQTPSSNTTYPKPLESRGNGPKAASTIPRVLRRQWQPNGRHGGGCYVDVYNTGVVKRKKMDCFSLGQRPCSKRKGSSPLELSPLGLCWAGFCTSPNTHLHPHTISRRSSPQPGPSPLWKLAWVSAPWCLSFPILTTRFIHFFPLTPIWTGPMVSLTWMSAVSSTVDIPLPLMVVSPHSSHR